jgi:hypothetical protein
MSQTLIVHCLHPDYGLAEDTRHQALVDAQAMGVRSAARLHNVSLGSIYYWRKRMTLENPSTLIKEAANG